MSHIEDSRSRLDDLRRVARYQRWVIACILTQLVLGLLWLVLVQLDSEVADTARTLLWNLLIPIGVAGGIFAFLVYWTVRDPFWAAVMGVASIPPVMGVLALTVVNGTATRTLKESGVTVGFFGANPQLIEKRSYLSDAEELGW